MILPYVCVFFFFFKEKKRKKKKEEREINIDPEDFPRFAVFDTRLPEHAIRSSITVLCLFVSLQGQLANDDSDDEEEDAQRQHAGAQALFPHGRAHQGGGVRAGHGGHLSLPQSVVLLRGEQGEKKKKDGEAEHAERFRLKADTRNNRISCTPLLLCRQTE